MTKEELKQLPKVELHCHLDGSLSREFIEKRLGRQVSQEELTVSDDCTSLAEYLEKFDIPGRCLMDEQGLAEAGYDVLRSMSQENVCYAEIRFAPLFSETEDMNCSKVIEALLSGLERGRKDFGVEYGVLTCAMRHHSEEENYRMLKAAREYLGSGVCGADLAGAEGVHGTVYKSGETGDTFYSPCRRMWKSSEYHRFCAGRSKEDRTWYRHAWS